MTSELPEPPSGFGARLRGLFQRATRPRSIVLACFVDDLTPNDERLLRALLADEDGRP
ncbi:MAG TPA: hypothetical protein VGM75_12015 [Pseudonocardiaceae bacterium]